MGMTPQLTRLHRLPLLDRNRQLQQVSGIHMAHLHDSHLYLSQSQLVKVMVINHNNGDRLTEVVTLHSLVIIWLVISLSLVMVNMCLTHMRPIIKHRKV